MQRYLRPDLLDAAGIEVFDTWAATFGQVVTQVELAPEGGDSFRVKSRFARFRNVPEMLRMWHVFADVKTAADLDLPVPILAERPSDGRRIPETVTVEPSDELIDYVADLGSRADAIRNRAVSPEEDNMLKVSGDGRRAALDLRLVGLPHRTPGKIEAAAASIASIWRAHRGDEYLAPDGTPYPVRGSLQLVFCDLGTPGPEWNAYDELRGQLVARGLSRESVRFVHEAKNDTELARLFAACRSGHVAVLVGSTEKMGVGTNVQDRAVALHHLDAPWRPADVAQREGRIIRQGNLNPEVQVIRWTARQSFDGYMWQTLERKARFIRDVMSPALDAREIGDIGDTVLSFSEAKALATNNPLLIDKAEADARLARLVRAERAHHRNQDTLRRTITRLEAQIAAQTKLGADIDAAIGRRRDTRGEAFTMTVQGQRYTKRADAGQHLLGLLRREAANQLGYRQRTVHAGGLGGFPLIVTISQALGQVTVSPAFDGGPGTGFALTSRDLAESDPVGLVTRLENRLTRLEAGKAKTLADIDLARSEIQHATASLGQPFPQAAELDSARQRAREIDEQLEAAASPPASDPAAEATTDAQQPGEASTAEAGPAQKKAGPGPASKAKPGTEATAGIAVLASPPWPSSSERQSGPTPAGPGRRDTGWAPPPLRPRQPFPAYHRDGESPHRPRADTEPGSEEREAGQ
jgi:hypothetical protein